MNFSLVPALSYGEEEREPGTHCARMYQVPASVKSVYDPTGGLYSR